MYIVLKISQIFVQHIQSRPVLKLLPFKLNAILFEGHTFNYTNLLRVASNLCDIYFYFPFKLLP